LKKLKMVNKVILIGNLGRDPEVRRLENGAVVAKFSVATNENYKDKSGEWQTQTEWHDVVAWRHLAERAERDLAKGKMVYIEGKLSHRKYQDKDGKDRYITEVVANNLRLLEKKEGSGSGFSQNMPTEEPAVASTPSAPSSENTVEEAGEDDLPF
jgi:single-strand DNA-binding protein